MAKQRDPREGAGGAATVEGPPPAPASPPTPPMGPPRPAKIGEWVHYYRMRDHRAGTLAPIPAQVIYHATRPGCLHLNVHDLGEVIATMDVGYVSPDSPRVGHWTFPPAE